MKKMLLFLLVLSPGCLLAQKSECARFHNGIFTTKSQTLGKITVSRHGNTQTETTSKGTFIFNVKWISDCTCTLSPTPETIAKYKFPADVLLTTTINKPKKKSYYQLTSSNKTAMKAGSEMVKIGN